MRRAIGASFAVSKPKTSAAASPSIRRVSATGMSWKVVRSQSAVFGQVPSGCGKSLPHRMLSTPISYRWASSRRLVLVAQMKTWRSRYSCGGRFSSANGESFFPPWAPR